MEAVEGQLLTSNLTPMQEFVEVHTLNGARRTNPYLDAGYRLLAVMPESEPLETTTKQVVVRKRVVFIVGRTADVEHFDPPQGKQPVSLASTLAPAD